MKTCSKCGEEKLVGEFYFSGVKQKPLARCKACYSYDSIKRFYGLSREEYDSMAAKGCAICGSQRFLQVDHDHSCCQGRKSCGGCVRALLCKRHNVVIGLLRESQDEMDAITNYLGRKDYS